MKNILVPTDLSDIAEDGLRVAVEIAKRVGGTIHQVNFIRHPFGASFSAYGNIYSKFADDENLFTVQLIRKHMTEMEALAKKYSTDGITINSNVYDEELVDGIDPYLKEHNIDLIVMGTTGEENFQEKFTGNHAEQVMAKASCPVISVKEGSRLKDLSRIVVGWDIDDQKKYSKAIKYLNEMSIALGSCLDIVYVSKRGDERGTMENNLRGLVTEYKLNNCSLNIVENDDVEDGILRFAHKINAGMIIMLSQAKSGMARLFTHSSSEELSRESDIPVYSINLHNI